MSVKFVTNQPVAYLTDMNTLVIADVQIGLEHELYKRGVVIHAQVDRFVRILDRLITKTGADRLVIVGDLKHTVPGTSLREDRELIRFFSHLVKRVEIVLVKGNHDTSIEGVAPDSVKIYEGSGVRIGKYGFFHGHAWPDKSLIACDQLFMGHLQPGIDFSNWMGYKLTERVWLKTRLDREMIKEKYKVRKTGELKLIVIPAFNKLLGSAPVNRMQKQDYHGPFSDGSLNLEDAEVYLLDGTNVGKLGKI
jgi:putative SbcD/Mre11-related phosphoesterase